MKTMILQVIKPSPLTWLFLALLMLAQVSFCTHTLFSEPSLSTTQYGIGTPIEISYRDGSRQGVHIGWTVLAINLRLRRNGAMPDVRLLHIGWTALAINLTACYLLSAITVALMKKVTGLHRPFPIYGGTVFGVVCLALMISIVFSKVYWGYFIHRPAVLAELDDVTSVTSIVPVTTEQTPTGEYRFVANADFSIADHIAYARKDPYYNLDERILVYLEEKRLLPKKIATSLDDTDFYDLVSGTGLLVEPQDGYKWVGLLDGVIIDARTGSGSQLVFLSATGRMVSNNHFPCYEMVFERHPQSGQVTFIRGQRFFFEIGRSKGAEWYVIWPIISLAGIILVLPIVTLIAGIRNTILARRMTIRPEPNV